MKRETQKTIITIKTFQRTVVHSRRKVKSAWCGHCSADTVIFPHGEAVEHLSAREILRLTEKGEIHLLETETGELFVCGNSLSAKNKLK